MRRALAALLFLAALEARAQATGSFDDERLDWLWKKNQNIRETATSKAYYDEDRTQPAGPLLYCPDLPSPAVPVPSTPPGSDTADIDVVTDLVLTEDTSVSGKKAWCAGACNATQKDWLEPRFGLAYSAVIKDTNNCVVALGIPSKWFYDYKAGVLFFESDPTNAGNTPDCDLGGSCSGACVAPFKLSGYRFIGNYLDRTHYMTELGATPGTPGSGRWGIYFRSDGLYYVDDAGVATGPISTGGSGSVTTVSVVTANGVSGSVATPTTTPAITLALGAITPTSVAASGAVTGSNLSGTNTGDDDVPEVGDFGALNPSACGANLFMTDITAGANVCTQPAFSNLSGTAAEAQVPLATAASNLICSGACVSPSEIDLTTTYTWVPGTGRHTWSTSGGAPFQFLKTAGGGPTLEVRRDNADSPAIDLVDNFDTVQSWRVSIDADEDFIIQDLTAGGTPIRFELGDTTGIPTFGALGTCDTIDSTSGALACGTDDDSPEAADIQANSVDGTKIALGSDTQGDVMYYDGTNWVRLPKGTAGQVIEMNAGATAPEWDTDDTGSGGIATVEENNASVTTAATVLDFLGVDFDVTGATVEADVAIAAAIARDSEVPGLETDPGVPLLALADAGNLCAALQSTRRDSGDANNECFTALVTEVDGSTTNEIEVVDEAYSSANFDGGTAQAVSQDDLYDLLHIGDTDDDGLHDALDADAVGASELDGAGVETELEGLLDLDQLQGNLGVSHLNSGTGASSTTFWRGDGTWGTPSGGAGDITDVWGCTTGNCNALTAAAGDTLDAGSADAASPATRSTSLPGTCAEGQFHQDTDSGGAEFYVCTATNTWTKLTTAIDFDTSAELDTIVTDDNSGGVLVFGTQPTFTDFFTINRTSAFPAIVLSRDATARTQILLRGDGTAGNPWRVSVTSSDGATEWGAFTGTGCVQIGVGNGTCLCPSSDRVYHDTDCDATKEAGEEFIDFSTGPPQPSMSFTIPGPDDADNFIMGKLLQGITVTDIHCLTVGGTSAVIDIQERTSTGTTPTTLDATITCDSDGAEDDGALSNGGMDAGDWFGIDLGTVVGAVTQVAVTIFYTVP